MYINGSPQEGIARISAFYTSASIPKNSATDCFGH